MRSPRWHLVFGGVVGGLVASAGFVLGTVASVTDTLTRFDDALLALDDDPGAAELRPAA